MVSDSIKSMVYTGFHALGILLLMGAASAVIVFFTDEKDDILHVILYIPWFWFGWTFPSYIKKIYQEMREIVEGRRKL